MKIQNIDPSLLIFADETLAARPLANPQDKDYGEFTQLKKSIKDQGLLNTFSVTPREGGFLVLDGNRRGLAIQQLWNDGDEDVRARYPEGIPAQIMEMEDADVLLTQISGNANVKKQKPASLAKGLYRALLMTNITIDDLARRAGLSVAYTEQLLKLNTLPDDVKAAIDAGEITATNAFHLNSLPAEMINEEMIDQAKIKTGVEFANHVDQAKKAFKKAKQEGKQPGEVEGPVLFSATPKLRMKAELEGMYSLSIQRAEVEPTEANVAYANAMRWCFRMDDETLESDRAAFELAQKDKEAKAEARKAERAAKKRQELLTSIQSDPAMMDELLKNASTAQ